MALRAIAPIARIHRLVPKCGWGRPQGLRSQAPGTKGKRTREGRRVEGAGYKSPSRPDTRHKYISSWEPIVSAQSYHLT